MNRPLAATLFMTLVIISFMLLAGYLLAWLPNLVNWMIITGAILYFVRTRKI